MCAAELRSMHVLQLQEYHYHCMSCRSMNLQEIQGPPAQVLTVLQSRISWHGW